MIMAEGYTTQFDRNEFACARLEDANVSYKDLTQVCGRIRGKNADWAVEFLKKVKEGKAAVLYKKHNTRIGHRAELGGRRGRYPKKASATVLKVLQSAISNGRTRGMGDVYEIVNAAANKRFSYGRVAPKGRWARSDYEIARIEIVLKPLETVPKGVEVRPPKKQDKKPEKKPEEKPEKPGKPEKPEKKPVREIKEEKKPETKTEEKKEEPGKEEPKKEEGPKKTEEKKEEKPPVKKEEPKKEEKKSDANEVKK